jgi:hypothetical protein
MSEPTTPIELVPEITPPPTTTKRRRRQSDPVLRALASLVEALDHAGENDRRATIHWLAAKYLGQRA